MKEHFQDHGVRKWAGDDLIELQSESLEALQGLVEPYAPCIIKGCDVETVPGVDGSEPTYKVSGGLAALRGVDAAGSGCVKIVRVEEFTSVVMPVYLSLTNKQTSRAYGDGSSKVIANDYIAEHSAIASEGALELTSDGGKRLVDKIGITQKLDREGGDAKETVVGFTAAADRAELTTGSKLGILFGLVKKWLSDLRALAFKDKVAKVDLTDALAGELDGKVTAVDGMGLSDNNFTDALNDKLIGIETGANRTVVDAMLSASSKNPVTNACVTRELERIPVVEKWIKISDGDCSFKRSADSWVSVLKKKETLASSKWMISVKKDTPVKITCGVIFSSVKPYGQFTVKLDGSVIAFFTKQQSPITYEGILGVGSHTLEAVSEKPESNSFPSYSTVDFHNLDMMPSYYTAAGYFSGFMSKEDKATLGDLEKKVTALLAKYPV